MVGIHLVWSILVLSIITWHFSKSCLTYPAHPRREWCELSVRAVDSSAGPSSCVPPKGKAVVRQRADRSMSVTQSLCLHPSPSVLLRLLLVVTLMDWLYPWLTLLEAWVGCAVVPHKCRLHDALQWLLIKLQTHLVPKSKCQSSSKDSSPHSGLVWEWDGSYGWASDRSGDSAEESLSDLDFCNCELVLPSGLGVESMESCSKTVAQNKVREKKGPSRAKGQKEIGNKIQRGGERANATKIGKFRVDLL